MSDEKTPGRADDGLQQDGDDANEPFRASGSGASFDAAGNWGAERRRDQPVGDMRHGMEGAASGAGDGGFGPEGNYGGAAGQANADVLGQVNGDRDRLAERAQEQGPPKPEREFVGRNQRPVDRSVREGGDEGQNAGERERR